MKLKVNFLENVPGAVQASSRCGFKPAPRGELFPLNMHQSHLLLGTWMFRFQHRTEQRFFGGS